MMTPSPSSGNFFNFLTLLLNIMPRIVACVSLSVKYKIQELCNLLLDISPLIKTRSKYGSLTNFSSIYDDKALTVSTWSLLIVSLVYKVFKYTVHKLITIYVTVDFCNFNGFINNNFFWCIC